MAKLFVVLVAVCILHFSSAKVAPAPALAAGLPTPPTFTELAKQADAALGTLNSKFFEFVGQKSDNEFVKLVQTEGKVYADKLQELTKQLSEEAKSNAGKADELFKNLQTRLTGTIAELRAKNPELFSNGEKFQQKFQENLRTVVKDTEQFTSKLNQEGKEISTNVGQLLKQIYESTVDVAQKTVSNVETALKQKKN